MSLINLVRAAVNGTGTWQSVEDKFIALCKTGAIDVLQEAETFGFAFAGKFLSAEAASVISDAKSGDISPLGDQTVENVETAASSALGANAASPADQTTAQPNGQ